MTGCAPVLVEVMGSVGNETAGGGEIAGTVNSGQSMLCRQRDDQVAMDRRSRAAEHDQAAIRALRESRDGAFDLVGTAHVDGAHVYADRWRQRLDGAELARPCRYGATSKDRGSRHARRDLLEQFQPFSAHGIFEAVKPVALPPGRAWLST